MPDPKSDRSAMGCMCEPDGTLLERDPVAYFKRKHCNIDKQRRRLLAERLERRADESEWKATECSGVIAATDYEGYASKLRTIAARLRGTE